ncbi:MAG: 3-deoxy-D-manno-octulosonic acid transferase [Aquificae bacterium]|nr:3-deoxy-D-manno-octulosonic acid transferase [Aquificota bacterium]
MLKNWQLKKRLLIQKPQTSPQPPLWVHAASVGEFNTVLPLLLELKKTYPLFLTYFSPRAGQYLERYRNLFVDIFPLPLDLPPLIRHFESLVKPRALLVVERELWPSLLTFTKAPRVLLNAGWKGTLREKLLYRRFALVLTRTEKDANLIKPHTRGRVVACGNLKLLPPPEVPDPPVEKPPGKLLVAGSTHAGEEEVILKAFKRLRHLPLRLVLVPRHPERAKEVFKLSKEKGFKTAFLSEGGEDWEVLVVDRLGLLRSFYRVADLSIVGGTFVPVGGHNIAEPVLLGSPVLFGPYTFKVKELEELLKEEGVGFKTTAESLPALIEELLLNPPPVSSFTERSRKIKECYLRHLRAFLERV